jgi:hypothetical protein
MQSPDPTSPTPDYLQFVDGLDKENRDEGLQPKVNSSGVGNRKARGMRRGTR